MKKSLIIQPIIRRLIPMKFLGVVFQVLRSTTEQYATWCVFFLNEEISKFILKKAFETSQKA